MLEKKFHLRSKQVYESYFKPDYRQEQSYTGEVKKKINYLKITSWNSKEFYHYVTKIILESNTGNIPQGAHG